MKRKMNTKSFLSELN